jgi:hypothetical protein
LSERADGIPSDTATTFNGLADACRRVLDIASRVVGDVDLAPELARVDQYWSVVSEDAFELASAPELTVGSLAEDLEEVRESHSAPLDEHVLWHELEHAANILRFLAYLMAKQGL